MKAIDWKIISEDETLSEAFIRENKNNVYWRSISAYQTLSENFMLEMKEHVNWREIAEHQVLSLPFVLGNMEHLDIGFLYKNKKSGFTMDDKQAMKRSYVEYWKDSIQFEKHLFEKERMYKVYFNPICYPKTQTHKDIFVFADTTEKNVEVKLREFHGTHVVKDSVEVLVFNDLFSSLEELGRFQELLLYVLENEGADVKDKHVVLSREY